MKPTVYVDVLFVTNFITDMFLLYMVKCVCKNRAKIWRMIMASAIGGIYSVCMFFPDLSFAYSALFKIGASAAIVWVAFGAKSTRTFIKNFALFFLSSFVLAGASFLLFFMTGIYAKTGAAMSNGVMYLDINPFYVIVGAILCYIALSIAERVWVKYVSIGAHMHKITITYAEKSVNLHALLDTANAMSDPVTNVPVVVCSLDSVLPLFSKEEFYDKLREIGKTNSDKLKVELVCNTPFRLVPYRALGACADVMLSFFPKKFEVDGCEYEYGVLIGVCDTKLSSDRVSYDALLHPRIVSSLDICDKNGYAQKGVMDK